MKYGSRFSARYFEELYEEIKDIRTSERRIYQKITDIYATAIDYSPKAFESKEFFATVQNKLHFAICQVLEKLNHFLLLVKEKFLIKLLVNLAGV